MVKKFLSRYPWVTVIILIAVVGGICTLLDHPNWAQWAVSVVAATVALSQFSDMVRTLRSGSFGIDILAVTAIASTLAVGEYWAALVVCLMLTGGEALEDYAEERASSELTSLLAGVPTTARVRQSDGQIIEMDINQIEPGDEIVVAPHAVVPVDGILLSDTAVLDESSLTGESLPIERKKSDRVLSGALNSADAIVILASVRAEDSQYQRIVALVKDARESQAPFVRLADRVALPFTILAFTIAGGAWLATGDPMRFAQVLVVATPCPLIIAAPVAFMAGMSRAARAGIIVKSAASLEKVAKAKRVCFDKTGTLTAGEPQVCQVHSWQLAEPELLAIAASAEQLSAHPLAEALVRAAQQHGEIPPADRVQEIPAAGVSAVVAGDNVKVGKLEYVADEVTEIPDLPAISTGVSAIWVSRNGQIIGRIDIADPLRRETAVTVKLVNQLTGGRSVMLTGDTAATAQRIAAEIGINEVHAELLPPDKVNVVSGLGVHPVLMVGDGVNDAPVLAAADIGVAMGARGAAAATESADVVIMLDDLLRVPRLLLLSKRTMRVAWQAIMIGVSLSIVLMLIGATGVMPAFIGAWAQELVDLACILWALLAARPAAAEQKLELELEREQIPDNQVAEVPVS
ncbi:MAG: heavy metal translocating P-type ATPase [Trueperella sp.]|nr:heavy metal translocating P-type ATPase [Trueperella sp.]